MICPHCRGEITEEKEEPLHFFSVMWATNEVRPWVARIVKFGHKHGFEREFFNPLIDYSDAAAFGTRTVDIKFQFVLRVGWRVEVCTRQRRGEVRRFYRVTSPTELEEISAEEAAKWATRQKRQ